VRGEAKLNRTLRESPATASLHSATPKSFWAVWRGFGRLAGKNGGVQGEEIFARSPENGEKN